MPTPTPDRSTLAARLREDMLVFVRAEKEKASAEMNRWSDIEDRRPHFARLQAFAEMEQWLEQPKVRQAADALDAMAWQPMDTAPKDGTAVLLFVSRHGRDYWCAAHWLQCDDGSSGWIGSSFWSEPEGNWTSMMGEAPIAWMPLPPAPPTGPREGA